MLQTSTQIGRRSRESAWREQVVSPACLILLALFSALIWAYWTSFGQMADRWTNDPQYSHGFLVPVFALVVLWFRRDLLPQVSWQPCLLGLPVLVTGLGIRLVAVRMGIEPLDALSVGSPGTELEFAL